MRTDFSPSQLDDPHLKAAESSLRACVHCGICTASCPTYVLLGDERDSPRGRIALMQRMLENDAVPSAETVLHIDRCLSCLGCRTSCPSSVDYADLIDTARVHIAKKYRRPWPEKLFRHLVLFLLTRPKIFAIALGLGRLFAPVAKLLSGGLGAMVRKIPPARPRLRNSSEVATGTSEKRIALLPGCVQRVLAPEIDQAASRVLARQGTQLVPLPESGCCGALALHMGEAKTAKRQARALMDCVERRFGTSVDVLITASGCAAFLKDYPRLFAGESDLKRAQGFAARVRDFSDAVTLERSKVPQGNSVKVAYHPPCSLQHGQRSIGRGEALLKAAGFTLVPFAESHLCCGSAGSYSLLQPEISDALRRRKLDAIAASGAEIIVTGNIGCLMQLSDSGGLPVRHLAEILEGWNG